MTDRDMAIMQAFEQLQDAIIIDLKHSAEDARIDRLALTLAAVAKLHAQWMNAETPTTAVVAA